MSAKKKLIATGITILIAVPLLAAGTYAWLTVSTAPEISNVAVNIAASDLLQVSDDGVEFTDKLNLNRIFNRNYAPLNPISTYDGENWYRPVYTSIEEEAEGTENEVSGTITGDFYRVDFTPKGTEGFADDSRDYTGHRNVPLPQEPEKPEAPRNLLRQADPQPPESEGEENPAEPGLFDGIQELDYDSYLSVYRRALDTYKTTHQAELSAADPAGAVSEALAKDYAEILDAYYTVKEKYLHIMADAYYICADIWLRAQTDGEYAVRLTVPALSDASKSYEAVNKDDRMFGSYVLYYYKKTDEDGSETFQYKSGGAETAVRVGFMLDQEGIINTVSPVFAEESAKAAAETAGNLAADSTLDPATFKIYEPNADQRSEYQLAVRSGEYDITGADSKGDAFLRDRYYTTAGEREAFTNDEYQNGNYLWTSPVMKSEEAGSGSETEHEAGTENGTGSGCRLAAPEDLLDRLIVQKKSFIDLSLTLPEEGASAGTENNPLIPQEEGGIVLKRSKEDSDPPRYMLDARYVNLGRFIKNTDKLMSGNMVTPIADAPETDLASDTVLLKLNKNDSRRVRVFLWVEGQDPDCWNDIAEGSVLVNLEFAGEKIEESADAGEAAE